jgi:hypothetical protein
MCGHVKFWNLMHVVYWQLGITAKPMEPPKFKVVPTTKSAAKSETATLVKAEVSEDSDEEDDDEDDESKSAAKKKAKAKSKSKKNKP